MRLVIQRRLETPAITRKHCTINMHFCAQHLAAFFERSVNYERIRNKTPPIRN